MKIVLRGTNSLVRETTFFARGGGGGGASRAWREQVSRDAVWTAKSRVLWSDSNIQDNGKVRCSIHCDAELCCNVRAKDKKL